MTETDTVTPEGGGVDQLSSGLNQLSCESEGTHPLLLPVVVTRLVEVCRLSDIPKFRLVCKLWHSLSLSRTRNEMTVKIHQLAQEEKTLDKSSSPFHVPPPSEAMKKRLQWETFEGKLEVGENSALFTSFSLGHFQFCVSYSNLDKKMYGKMPETEYKLIHKNMNQFLNMYERSIRKLELVKCVIRNMDAFNGSLYNMPNLEELKLIELSTTENFNEGHAVPVEMKLAHEIGASNVRPKMKSLTVDTWDYEVAVEIDWCNLFSHFPCIEKLELKNLHLASNVDIIRIVQVLEFMSTSTVNPYKGTITDLRLSRILPGPGSALVRLFKLPQVKLTTLHFDVQGCENTHMSVLPTIIRHHGATLKTLWLTDWPRAENHYRRRLAPYQKFPFQEEPLHSLTELRLEGFVFTGMNFLMKVPNLKVLQVLQDNMWILNETNIHMQAELSHLHEFQFIMKEPKNFLRPVVDMELLFVRVMPNVTSFCGQLVTQSFHILCQSWKQLRHLKIYSTSWRTEVKWKKEKVKKIGDEELTGMYEGCGENRTPNITDLKDLRTLSLANMGKISDLSIWEGFLKLPHLNTLTVKMSHETSDKALCALREHVPHGIIVREAPRRGYSDPNRSI